MVDIGSTGRCFCNEGHEKRCSQMGKPSQHVWEQAAHLIQQPEVDWLSRPNAGRVPSVCGLLDTLNRHHCLAKMGRPALWRSTRTLPRVQRVVERITLQSSHLGGSLHSGRFICLPSKSQNSHTRNDKKNDTESRRPCSVMMETYTKLHKSAILFATTVN